MALLSFSSFVVAGLLAIPCLLTQVDGFNAVTTGLISKPVDLFNISTHTGNSIPSPGRDNGMDPLKYPVIPVVHRRRPRGWCSLCSDEEPCANKKLSCLSGRCVKKLRQASKCNNNAGGGGNGGGTQGRGGDEVDSSPPNSPAISEWCGVCGDNIAECSEGLECIYSHCIKRSHIEHPCNAGKPCELAQCLGGQHCAPCGLREIPCGRGHSCVKNRCVLQGISRKSCDRKKARVCEPCNAERKCVGRVCRGRRNGRRRSCRRVRCHSGFCAFNAKMAKRRCLKRVQKGGKGMCRRRRRRRRRRGGDGGDGGGGAGRAADRFEDDVMAAVERGEMENMESDGDVQWMSLRSSIGEVDEVDEDEDEDEDEQDDIYLEWD